MTRLLIAFTLLFAPAVHAQGKGSDNQSLPQEVCEAALRPSFESWATLTHIDGPQVPSFDSDIQVYKVRVGLLELSSEEVGHMKLILEGETLHVKEIFLSETYKGRGLSTYLFAKALTMFPQTKQVRGALFFDNGKAFAAELSRTGNQVKAFKATPFYKAWAKLGFSRIVYDRSYVLGPLEGIEAKILTLEKPGTSPPDSNEQLATPKDHFQLQRPKPML